MKISIIVEGQTEKEFIKRVLKPYLEKHLSDRMPRLDPVSKDGRIPKGEKLRSDVKKLLSGKDPADYVFALTDVYTKTNDFIDAADAKKKMREWVGKEPRFFPHAAQYEFEAWLLPYWSTIQRLTKRNTTAPSGKPETVNHNKPPSHHIREMFGAIKPPYSKPVYALRILRGNDLSVAVEQCPELKEFVTRIISLCNPQ